MTTPSQQKHTNKHQQPLQSEEDDDFESASEGENEQRTDRDKTPTPHDNEKAKSVERPVVVESKEKMPESVETGQLKPQPEPLPQQPTQQQLQRQQEQQQQPQQPQQPRSFANAFAGVVEEPAQQTAPAQDDSWGGGWGGGWGGWISSAAKAVSSVTEVIEKSDIGKAAMSTVNNVSSKVYEALDPEFEKERALLEQQGQSESGAASQSTGTENANIQQQTGSVEGSEERPRTGSQPDVAEAMLSTIDKTFDTMSDFLGNTLLSAYKKTQDLHISDQISKMKSEVESSEVVHEGFEKGLGMLEGLGKMVGGAVAGKFPLQTLSPTGSSSSSAHARGGSATQSVTQRDHTMETLFEDNAGNAHVQALEMLSTESSLKLAASSPSSLSPGLQQQLKEIEELLDMDSILEEVEAALGEESESEHGVQDLVLLLDRLNIQHSMPRISTMNNLLSSAKSSTMSEQDKSALIAVADAWASKFLSEDKALVEDALKTGLHVVIIEEIRKRYVNMITTLAGFGEKSCEQLLRIAEVFLIRIAEEKLNDSKKDNPSSDLSEPPSSPTLSSMTSLNAVESARVLRTVLIRFMTEIQTLATHQQDHIKALSKAFESWYMTTASQALRDRMLPSSDSNSPFAKVMDRFKNRGMQLNQDTEFVVERVQEGGNAGLNILKLLAVTMGK